MENEFYTIREVARLLKVSPPTVWQIIRRGQLAAVKISPRVTRVSKDALEMYLAKNR